MSIIDSAVNLCLFYRNNQFTEELYVICPELLVLIKTLDTELSKTGILPRTNFNTISETPKVSSVTPYQDPKFIKKEWNITPVVPIKEDSQCPKCGAKEVMDYDSNEDVCLICHHHFSKISLSQ